MNAGALRVGVFAALWLLASGAIASARELKTIGVSLPDLEIPFFSEVNRGITTAAKRIGAEVTQVSNHNDVGQQTQQIQDFVAKKIDLIILYPDNEQALGPIVKQAKAAGAFVVAVGRRLDVASANVGTNTEEAASLACKYLAEQLGQKGNVVIINGQPDPVASARVQGCEKSIAEHPEMKVLSSDQNGQWTEQGGKMAMVALLQKFNTIDGVFAVNSDEARGAETGIRSASPSRNVKAIVSIGNTILDTSGLTKDSLIAAVVIQKAYSIGEQAVQIGTKLLNGEKVPTDVSIPPVVVNRQTLESYPDCCHFVPPKCTGCVVQ
jgi:ribose transport system substrate-binding protein